MNWQIEHLAPHHVRKGFHCGEPTLDAYIQKYAGQHGRKDVGRTFVAVGAEAKQVLGYYTLSSFSVDFLVAPPSVQRKLPQYPIPVALLGKLAVDKSQQGTGLGSYLLLDALHRVLQVSGQLAIHAVEVHAINDSARSFYMKYGFEVFADDPNHLFLPLATVRQAIGK